MTQPQADVLLERFQRAVFAASPSDRLALIEWIGEIIARLPDGDPIQFAVLELLLNGQIIVTGMVNGEPRIQLAPHLHDEAFAQLHESPELRREVERLIGRPLSAPPQKVQ